jgi:hypothetical protein
MFPTSQSAFRFEERNDIDITFTDKYKGWISKVIFCKPAIQIVINRLLILKTSNNYKKLNKELRYLRNGTTIFLTPYDCEFVLNTFNKITTIRHFLNKYVYSTLKVKNINPKETINSQDLQFQEFTPQDKNVVTIENDSKIYKFRISEILTIYKFAVYNIDSNYMIPEPIIPKNPYTNEELTLRQQYILYEKLLSYFCKKGKTLPEHYILMKNSYFSTEKFKIKYYCYLIYKCAITETQNLSDDEWFMNIDNYLCEYEHYCRICFRKTKNVRKLFSGILELFVLNEHDVYSYGDAENEYIKIAKKHGLVFDEKHEMTHRRISRARRPARWRPIQNTQEATETTSTNTTQHENQTNTETDQSTINSDSENQSTTNSDSENQSTTSSDSETQSDRHFSGFLEVLESESLGLLPSEGNSAI